MKTKIKSIILFIVLISGSWIEPQKTSAQVSVSFQVFYDNLSPYGYWVDNSDYGYVWIPNVSPGFTPYGTNGYWLFTNAGWTWISNYPWGWAPFHYGCWYFDPMYGFIWVPDFEWGPGWVVWRRCEGYYGWAPIGPRVNINTAYGNSYNVPRNHWKFIKDKDLGSTDISNNYVSSSDVTPLIDKSTVINNLRSDKISKVTYSAGPDKTEVEKVSGKTFTPVAIKESSKPGQNLSKDQLEIYKPQVQVSTSAEPKPAPFKVTNLKDVKTSEQKSGETPQQKENKPVQQNPPQPQQINPPLNTEGEDQPQYKNEPPLQPPPQPKQAYPPNNSGGEVQPQHKNDPPLQPSPQLQKTNQTKNKGGKHPY